MDKLLQYTNVQYSSNQEPVGVLITDTSTLPTVQRIDKNGIPFTPDSDYFHNNEIFQSYKCTIDSTGNIVYGTNPRGDGLNLTGANGDVMARHENVQYRYEYDSGDLRLWFAPFHSNHRFYKYHPHCYQNGGTLIDHFFIGTYKAGLTDDNGTLKLNSYTGVQPWTGGQMRSVPFTSGTTEFTVGETITGTNGAMGTVVSWHKASGDWSLGTAAGTVYIRNHGVNASTATTFTSGDTLTRTSGSATTSGVSSVLNLNVDQAHTYATNKGAGWTIDDIWSNSLLIWKFVMQYGTRNSNTAIGLGVCNHTTGTGYNGLLNGAGDIDSALDYWGTGHGTGIDGDRTISWNNMQDYGDNVFEFVIGVNTLTTGEYRVINRNGICTVAGSIPSGSYETGYGVVPTGTNGYISKIQTDEMGALAGIPLSVGGTDTQNYCDFYYYGTSSPAVMLYGGGWTSYYSGMWSRIFTASPTTSSSTACARLKYIPQS